MNSYCCQIVSVTGRVLEIFFEDFLDAVNECTEHSLDGTQRQAYVYRYPDMVNPICSARIL